MAKLKGINCLLYDGSTIIPTENWQLEEGMTLIDTSEQGDSGEEFTATLSNGSVSFDGFFDPSVAGLTGLITKLRAGTAISFTGIFSGVKASGSAVGVTGTFTLEKFTRKTGKKDMVTFSASGKISGAVTDATNL
jgi:catabolite regulation protein CreA